MRHMSQEVDAVFRCPNCGYRLLTAEDVAKLTGESTRTLQRRLESGGVSGAIREQVPGGFRWLIPLAAAEKQVAAVVPALLKKVLPELEAVRTAEKRRARAEASGEKDETDLARREADDAFGRAMTASRYALDWFTWLQGWKIDSKSAPLIGEFTRASNDLRRALYRQGSEDRLVALASGIKHLNRGIRLCEDYGMGDSPRDA